MATKNRSALLVMDQQQVLIDGVSKDPVMHLSKAQDVIDAARCAGMTIIYIVVGFRNGYPEIGIENKMFNSVRDNGILQLSDQATGICNSIKPKASDIVIIKKRVSAFEGTELETVLRAGQINELVMFGVTTSGVVLSTVRTAADRDFKITVISDLCLDRDDTVNEVLLDTVFPAQSEVITTAEFLDSLSVRL
jgi:nicotinamidase-related amidase